MPVRVRIHSSLVSTIFSKSAFVSTRGGTYVPRAVILARARWPTRWVSSFDVNGPLYLARREFQSMNLSSVCSPYEYMRHKPKKQPRNDQRPNDIENPVVWAGVPTKSVCRTGSRRQS